MIVEYHRPDKIDLALALLAREDPLTLPLAGGTALNRPSARDFAVVDLQALGLNKIDPRGIALGVGATVTLEQLLHSPELPDDLRPAIRLEATYNLRQMATVAGSLVAADGRSPFTTCLLGLDARLLILPDKKEVDLGDFLPLRAEGLAGRLITNVTIPTNVRLRYEYVARTPADRPLVCVAAARWPSGRTRVALGGYGTAPILAFDGPEAAGVEVAVGDAYSHAEDHWASAEYRREVAATLTARALQLLEVP